MNRSTNLVRRCLAASTSAYRYKSCLAAARRAPSPRSVFQPQRLLLQTRSFCSKAAVQTDIDSMVSSARVVVFMKGTPEEPLCGFSRAVAMILQMHGAPFAAFNVLEDEQLRADIKTYSDWPTIPQVYMDKELVGGCDLMIEMHKDGSLVEKLSEIGIKSKLLDKEGEEKK